MSLLRTTTKACPRAALTASSTPSRAPRRHASDHASHDAHHDAHAVDTTVYPKEGFSTRFWVNSAVLTTAAIALYQFAPAADGSSTLTRWISSLHADEGHKELNAKHLDLAYADIEARRTIQEANKPPSHVYRWPQSFDMVTPHAKPVGPTVDLTNFTVKKE